MKPVKIVLLDNAEKEYKNLNKIVGKQIKDGFENSWEMQLLKSIKQKSKFIKENPFYGNNIPKKLIPKKYDVLNLWRVELTDYWRMLYTIKGDQVQIVCFVLDIVDHKKYNKLFRYKNK